MTCARCKDRMDALEERVSALERKMRAVLEAGAKLEQEVKIEHEKRPPITRESDWRLKY